MSGPPANATREIVRTLQEQVRRCERARRGAAELVCSGCLAFDRLLPDGGFCRGTLVEWLAAAGGNGAATLALAVACRACRDGGALVVVDRARLFYPPAAFAYGIDSERLIVVRPRDEADEGWALDQVLRSPGVGAVLCWPGKLPQRQLRRMQLAAEAGGTLGLLVRPERARGEPSWAESRLLVASQPVSRDAPAERSPEIARRLRIEVLHARSGPAGGKIELQLDEQTGDIYESRALDLVSRLAAPAIARRA